MQNGQQTRYRGIVLSPSETIIKDYLCSLLSFPKCSGRLIVTNQRVIFHGSAGSANVQAGESILPNLSHTASVWITLLVLFLGVVCLSIGSQGLAVFLFALFVFFFARTQGWIDIYKNQGLKIIADGSGSRIINEVPVNTVSGLSSFYGGRFFGRRLVIGIICLAICVYQLFANNGYKIFLGTNYSSSSFQLFIVVATAAIALACLSTCYRRAFFLKIFASRADGAPITIGEGITGLFGNTAILSIQAAPTGQTDSMMLELGALINDLQNMGDQALNRWMPPADDEVNYESESPDETDEESEEAW